MEEIKTAHAVNSEKQTFLSAITSCKGILLNRGRGPSRSREARGREALTGDRDSVGLSGREWQASSAICALGFRALAQLPSAL